MTYSTAPEVIWPLAGWSVSWSPHTQSNRTTLKTESKETQHAMVLKERKKKYFKITTGISRAQCNDTGYSYHYGAQQLQPPSRAPIAAGTARCAKAPLQHSFFCRASAPKWGSKAAKTEQGAGEAGSQGLLPARLGGGHGSRKGAACAGWPAPHRHHEEVAHQPLAPCRKSGKSIC